MFTRASSRQTHFSNVHHSAPASTVRARARHTQIYKRDMNAGLRNQDVILLISLRSELLFICFICFLASFAIKKKPLLTLLPGGEYTVREQWVAAPSKMPAEFVIQYLATTAQRPRPL